MVQSHWSLLVCENPEVQIRKGIENIPIGFHICSETVKQHVFTGKLNEFDDAKLCNDDYLPGYSSSPLFCEGDRLHFLHIDSCQHLLWRHSDFHLSHLNWK